jgi:hypothetical protein
MCQVPQGIDGKGKGQRGETKVIENERTVDPVVKAILGIQANLGTNETREHNVFFRGLSVQPGVTVGDLIDQHKKRIELDEKTERLRALQHTICQLDFSGLYHVEKVIMRILSNAIEDIYQKSIENNMRLKEQEKTE